ncbi:MAG: hypothetical protein M1608_14745 [Candidatus Omnitrophica bacterium]|nr:hypothetical protein [Candidatus Omnitrophota bacterium]
MIDQQKKLGREIQKLQRDSAQAGAAKRETLMPRLDNLIANQSELNEKLNQQAERMEHFVRTNPLYDVETDLQERLRQQAAAIRLSTQTNNAATSDVARRSSPPGGPRQLSTDLLAGFKKASDDQLARLGGVHEENEKQIVQTLDEMDLMQQLINDFNLFKSLYRAQQELAEQSRAYNRPAPLTRENQLALKDLAASENQVSALIGKLRQKLRVDAQAADKLFPKAAQSGRDLADQVLERRLESLAEMATGRMLNGDGEQSFQLAERLRGEMEKMFNDCQGGNCPSGNELDAYLRLRRMNPNNNFAQMALSRKFGFGLGQGIAGGQGDGMLGESGYAVMDGSTLEVLGNESRARNSSRASPDSRRFGNGTGALASGGRGEVDKSDTLTGLNPVNRQSAAVSSEATLEEYNDVVENYFKAITTRKAKPANEKPN